MYSVVLLMAMTSGGDVADLGHRHGGCCGGEVVYSSCCGGYSSCCGGYSSCCGGNSCCGGGLFRHHRHHGGCCGGESYGCCGGAVYSGCCGGYSAPVDCGCGAVVTGCTGGAATGATTGGGEEHVGKGTTDDAQPAELTPEETEHMKVLIAAHPEKKDDIEKYMKSVDHDKRKTFWEESKPADDKKPDDKKPDDKKPDGKDKTMIQAPATIIVSMPSDATLTIDDAVTFTNAAPRIFTSPVLPAGRDFHYTLKAEMVRNGKPVVVSKQVTVRAGEETHVTLEAGINGVASR